jgi:hypothetical protein
LLLLLLLHQLLLVKCLSRLQPHLVTVTTMCGICKWLASTADKVRTRQLANSPHTLQLMLSNLTVAALQKMWVCGCGLQEEQAAHVQSIMFVAAIVGICS